MRISPPEGSVVFLDHRPELFAAFNRFYGTLWTQGRLDQGTKEVARLRNARVTGCGICRNLRFDGAREEGLTEDLVEHITDAYEDTNLPERYKLAIRFADVLLGPAPRPPDVDLQRALHAELDAAEIVELALTTVIAQGFSKAAVAWGPAPDIPLMIVPTPTPDASIG